MAATVAFTPTTAGTVTISVTGSSAVTALTKSAPNQQIYVQSLAASAVCFVEFGTAAVTAAIATGFPILPGQRYCFNFPGVTSIAVIGTAGTLYVTTGNGIMF